MLHWVLALSLVATQTNMTLTSTTACSGPPSEACERALADAYDRLSIDCLHALTQESQPPDLLLDDSLSLSLNKTPPWAMMVGTGVVGLIAGLITGLVLGH